MSHLFVPDPIGHANHTGPVPCRWCPCQDCPLPFANQVHELPDTAEAQAEHLRRIGDDQ